MAWDDIGQLVCAHCAVKFTGTKRQVCAVKYESKPVYCSTACRSTALASKFRKPKPAYGPCPTCGKRFESRRPKTFCSLSCYMDSPRFEEVRDEARAKAGIGRAEREGAFRADNTLACLGCGEDFYAPPARKKKFCKHSCYRSYMADRFDRWVASPERIALPQNFDEFLAQAELPCLVDGCGWTGHNLSQHMNYAHGIPADEFKRAAGFNITTGVISASLSDTLAASHASNGSALRGRRPPEDARDHMTGYKSLEGREHARKARLLASGGPLRICVGCGEQFTQSTPFGRAKYCSRDCRSSHYKEKYAA